MLRPRPRGRAKSPAATEKMALDEDGESHNSKVIINIHTLAPKRTEARGRVTRFDEEDDTRDHICENEKGNMLLLLVPLVPLVSLVPSNLIITAAAGGELLAFASVSHLSTYWRGDVHYYIIYIDVAAKNVHTAVAASVQVSIR